MKLYDSKMAPNPRRLRIFLAEKGIQVPDEQVDLAKAQNRAPEFLKINPYDGVPVLELDDGTNLAESVAICRYFEETHPEPRLMGVDARDKALVEMWQRRMELNLLAMVAGAFRNTSDFFKGRIPQVAEYGESSRQASREGVRNGRRLPREKQIHRRRAVYHRRHHGVGRDRLRQADQAANNA